MAVSCSVIYWKRDAKGFGMPEHFHRYWLLASPWEASGWSVVSIVVITSGSNRPTEEHKLVKGTEADAIADARARLDALYPKPFEVISDCDTPKTLTKQATIASASVTKGALVAPPRATKIQPRNRGGGIRPRNPR